MAYINYWQKLLNKQKGVIEMAKDAEGNKIKKDKTGKGEKGDKKDKGEKKSKEAVVVVPITNALLEGVSNAKIVKTLEDTAKLETTPNGDYFVDCHAGKIRVRKSDSKVTWQLNDKQITRPELYRLTKTEQKEEPPKGNDEGETGKADKKGKKGDKKGKGKVEETDKENTPADSKLAATYKKKQLLNILKTGQFFKKRIIKEVESAITEKKLTGSAFIAAIDTATGKETALEVITKIFEAV